MSRYLSLLNWLFRDAFKHFPRLSSLAIILQFSAAAFQVGIGIVLVLFLQREESKTNQSSSEISSWLNADDFLIPVAIAMGAFFAVSAIINFLSEYFLTKLQRRYEEYNALLVLKKINQLDAKQFATSPVKLDFQTVTKTVNAYSRFSAIAQRLLLRCIVPATVMTLSIAYLMYSNFWISYPLAIFIIIAVLPFRFINKKAIQISQKFEQFAAAAAKAKITIINKFENHSTQEKDRLIEDSIMAGSNADFLNIYEERLNISNLSSMASALAASIVLAILFILMSYKVADGEANWSDLVLVFIALRFAFSAIQKIVSLITSINRFHSMLETIHGIVRWKPSAPLQSISTEIKLPKKIDCYNSKTQKKSFSLNREARRFLIAPNKMSRLALFQYLKTIGVSRSKDFGKNDAPNFLVFDKSLPKDSAITKQQLKTDLLKAFASLSKKEVDEKDPQFIKHLDASLTIAFANDGQLAIFLNRLLNLSLEEQKFVFIDQVGLTRYPKQFVEALLKLFKHSDLTIYAFRTIQLNRIWSMEEFILYDGTEVTAVVNSKQLNNIHASLAEYLTRNSSANSHTNIIDDEDLIEQL